MDRHFRDWEAYVFGFGYGTGERYTLPALKTFLAHCGRDPDSRGAGYNYEDLESALTPTVAWLLINALAHADIIEYGTSPRFGWLTAEGMALKAYVDAKTADELYEIAMADEEEGPCYPDFCNCGEDGPCARPFFPKVPQRPVPGLSRA